MKKWVLTAAAAATLAGSANAAVITLQGVSNNGPNDNTFTYQGTLGPDEGLRAGDRLVIYDFAGYIAGSIFSPSATVIGTTEFTSSDPVTPGFTDDPTLVNLVFTYVGPDFRNQGGPFTPLDFNGLGARSAFGQATADAFFTLTTKNNPDGVPGGSNSPVFTLGSVSVPTAVPEPTTWALMLGGFGVVGMATRRRARIAQVTA
ncbi:PEPxxWA-CTERM sorting domain-containing protein [Sphingomonas sp. ID1715]|uniref:PEPxxWA-CTERM sorting domain-containing protein n=1 Tax=Sphingomonas sp. ID1715 TaxID=1656898 RepID=UPI0020C35258|nr:PEPxxWA-CTERM sorting domain-containing protein [Sphingomonas sp. ID1715]